MKRFILLATLLAAATLPMFVKPASAQDETEMSGPRARRVIGVIDDQDLYGFGPIQVPKVAQAGKDFEIRIMTSGGGCENQGDEKVTMSGNTATVKVYDLTTGSPGRPCQLVGRSFPHTVTLRFTKPGKAIIKVVGRRLVLNPNPHLAPIRKPFARKYFITITPAEKNLPISPSSNSSTRTRHSPAARPIGA
jgi:hypothetical protein